MSRSKLQTTLVMLIALGAVVLAGAGLLERAVDHIGLGSLASANQRYLEDSYDRALNGFLVLSAVKSGLAVIEGSEVGIGFSFQVGDLVQSVYDYVDVAWKTVLAGGTVLLITRLVLESVARVDHYFLALAFAALFFLTGVRCFSPGHKGFAAFFKSIAAACSFVVVLLYLVFPLTILGASHLSAVITKPLIEESYDAYRQVSRTFLQGSDADAVGAPADDPSAVESVMGLGQRYERLKKRAQEMEAYLDTQAKSLAETTFQLIAGYLFDCVVFPLAFLAVMILMVKGVPGYWVRLAQDRRLTHTIRDAVLPTVSLQQSKK